MLSRSGREFLADASEVFLSPQMEVTLAKLEDGISVYGQRDVRFLVSQPAYAQNEMGFSILY